MDLPGSLNIEVIPEPKPVRLETTIDTLIEDNSKSLILVQTRLYTDMNNILMEIYKDNSITLKQLQVQDIIQKHFIYMRKDLYKLIEKCIEESKSGKKSFWKKIFCR
jgi:hypothetical protein